MAKITGIIQNLNAEIIKGRLINQGFTVYTKIWIIWINWKNLWSFLYRRNYLFTQPFDTDTQEGIKYWVGTLLMGFKILGRYTHSSFRNPTLVFLIEVQDILIIFQQFLSQEVLIRQDGNCFFTNFRQKA